MLGLRRVMPGARHAVDGGGWGGGEVGNGHRVATGCFSLEGGPVLFSLGPHAPRGCEVDFSHVLFFFIFLSLFG